MKKQKIINETGKKYTLNKLLVYCLYPLSFSLYLSVHHSVCEELGVYVQMNLRLPFFGWTFFFAS